MALELHHGCNAGNLAHRWLLQYLFLLDINADIDGFVQGWNFHRLRRRGERTTAPIDLFNFGMQTSGMRGNRDAAGERNL